MMEGYVRAFMMSQFDSAKIGSGIMIATFCRRVLSRWWYIASQWLPTMKAMKETARRI
jgi:hypothetical protein